MSGMNVQAASDALWGQRSLSERFGNIKGRELQDKIWQMYQVQQCKDGGLMKLEFYQSDGSRNVVRHALNQRKQLAVRASYKRSILAYGILEGCSWHAVSSNYVWDLVWG